MIRYVLGMIIKIGKIFMYVKHNLLLFQPPHLDFFTEIYLITELMQSDLHKIIVSPQQLSADHIKVIDLY